MTPGQLDVDGKPVAAVGLTVENGRITRVYSIVNPHKLTGLDAEITLTR